MAAKSGPSPFEARTQPSLRRLRKLAYVLAPQGDGSILSTILPRGLQPRLRRRHALFPGLDLVSVPQRHPDIVEPFKEPCAIGRRDVERDVASARTADRLRLEIDREWRCSIGGDHARLEGVCIGGAEHDRQEPV